MNFDEVIAIATQAIHMAIWLSLPALAAALVIGVAISLFQAVTQIQEMTLTFVPKIFGVFIVIGLTLPWMLKLLIDFTRQLFDKIPTLIQ